MRAALLLHSLLLLWCYRTSRWRFRTTRLYRGFLLELGTVIGTTLNIALTGPGSWIHQMKAITAAENGGLNMAD
jgi:hypothetical protein